MPFLFLSLLDSERSKRISSTFGAALFKLAAQGLTKQHYKRSTPDCKQRHGVASLPDNRYVYEIIIPSARWQEMQFPQHGLQAHERSNTSCSFLFSYGERQVICVLHHGTSWPYVASDKYYL
jgi:hypothetical protein